MTPTIMLWAFAACGAAVAWSAMTAANFMRSTDRMGFDRLGWSFTGMIGLWAAIQPGMDKPTDVTPMLLMMAFSLAVQSWRLASAYRRPIEP